jgi:hypothetical protein
MYRLRLRHRSEVEIALVHGLSERACAERFGLSRDAIHRHSKRHLSASQAAAILMASSPTEIDLDALTEKEGSSLLLNLVAARARLASYGQQAAQEGQLQVAVQAERAVGSNLEICGKLLSKFVTRHVSEHRHLTLTPDYLRMRRALTDALRPFPEAGRAVVEALTALETEAAAVISSKPQLMIEAAP